MWTLIPEFQGEVRARYINCGMVSAAYLTAYKIRMLDEIIQELSKERKFQRIEPWSISAFGAIEGWEGKQQCRETTRYHWCRKRTKRAESFKPRKECSKKGGTNCVKC